MNLLVCNVIEREIKREKVQMKPTKHRSKIMQKMHIGNFAEGNASVVYCIWLYSVAF